MVAIAKAMAYKDMYKRLNAKEGKHGIYKLAKVEERRQRDLGNDRYIKDDNNQVLVI